MNQIHGMLLEAQHHSQRTQESSHPSSLTAPFRGHPDPDEDPFIDHRTDDEQTLNTRHPVEEESQRGEPMIRSILYFRGFGRQKIWHIRRLCNKLEIPQRAIQHISLIGANVTELIVPASFKGEVVERLERARIMHDPAFDPLAPTSFTNAATIDRLHLTTRTETEQRELAARQAFTSRIDTMLQEISPHRKGLTSFLSALKKAVEDGAPITRFLNQ
jgi:hypothetical protein